MRKTDYSPKSPLTLLILIGIMVISTLVVMSNYFLRPSIEKGFIERATQNLYQHGMQNAIVKLDSAGVVLTGSVQNLTESEKAEKMIQEIWDDDQIKNLLVIKNQAIE